MWAYAHSMDVPNQACNERFEGYVHNMVKPEGSMVKGVHC
jgi:hypothetical protein